MGSAGIKRKTREMELAKIRLEAADPCPIHGKDTLRICPYCLETIQCTECELIDCQCWNDE